MRRTSVLGGKWATVTRGSFCCWRSNKKKNNLIKWHDMDAFPLSQHINMKKEWKDFLQDEETKFTNRLKRKKKEKKNRRKLENRKFTRHEELLSLLHQTKKLTTTRRISVFVPSTGWTSAFLAWSPQRPGVVQQLHFRNNAFKSSGGRFFLPVCTFLKKCVKRWEGGACLWGWSRQAAPPPPPLVTLDSVPFFSHTCHMKNTSLILELTQHVWNVLLSDKGEDEEWSLCLSFSSSCTVTTVTNGWHN